MLSGWIFDLTGHYDQSFYAAGAWMLLSSILLLPIPLMVRRQQETNQHIHTWTFLVAAAMAPLHACVCVALGQVVHWKPKLTIALDISVRSFLSKSWYSINYSYSNMLTTQMFWILSSYEYWPCCSVFSVNTISKARYSN